MKRLWQRLLCALGRHGRRVNMGLAPGNNNTSIYVFRCPSCEDEIWRKVYRKPKAQEA